MNRLFVPTPSALRRKLPEVPRRPGYWLLLARGAWIVVAVLTVVYCLANIPGAYARVQTICAQRMCPLFPRVAQRDDSKQTVEHETAS